MTYCGRLGERCPRKYGETCPESGCGFGPPDDELPAWLTSLTFIPEAERRALLEGWSAQSPSVSFLAAVQATVRSWNAVPPDDTLEERLRRARKLADAAPWLPFIRALIAHGEQATNRFEGWVGRTEASEDAARATIRNARKATTYLGYGLRGERQECADGRWTVQLRIVVPRKKGPQSS